MTTPTRIQPITRDMQWFRGTDRAFQHSITDLTGVAVDVSGWALSWALYDSKEPAGVRPIFEKTVGSGIVITNGPGGIITASPHKADTVALAGDREYWYELCRTDSGLVDILACGPAYLWARAKR